MLFVFDISVMCQYGPNYILMTTYIVDVSNPSPTNKKCIRNTVRSSGDEMFKTKDMDFPLFDCFAYTVQIKYKKFN
jgi:hypothetical protein